MNELDDNKNQIYDVAMEAGRILLQNGAEISRVEETMERLCRYYGVESMDSFVLSNGIFITGGYESKKSYARVGHIPVGGASLDKVVAVNQLSREVEEGKYETPEMVKKELDVIANMPTGKKWQKILASGLGSGFFCVLAGGNFQDCLAAFIAGIILYTYVVFISEKYLSKILGNLFGGVIIVVSCVLCIRFNIGMHLENIISGAIMPMVPGVAFANGIRDIANGDYIAGAVRLLDAILRFMCIAIGVGVAFAIYHNFAGGVML
ncbi:MAG: threonine/serine exporter family protein [Lachnospiraceae bacterium]|nr:threonine/serine exporter family protein [Lachnospiraceae bacterium]